MTVTEVFLQTPGIRVAAKLWGPGDGLPVLALHGWLDNAASFDRLAPLLPDLRLVAVDLPGHGRSEHLPPAAAYHFVDGVPRILAVADALGWDRFHLLGHSMGAGIATLLPAAAPERIASLVLIEGLGPMTHRGDEAAGQLRNALLRERRALGVGSRVFPSFDAAVIARMADSDLDREAAELLVRRGSEELAGGVRFLHDRRLQSPSRLRFTDDQVASFLRAIACPVLVIRAQPGWPFPEELLARRRALIASLSYLECVGGHHLHLVDPAAVAAPIAAFLGR